MATEILEALRTDPIVNPFTYKNYVEFLDSVHTLDDDWFARITQAMIVGCAVRSAHTDFPITSGVSGETKLHCVNQVLDALKEWAERTLK